MVSWSHELMFRTFEARDGYDEEADNSFVCNSEQ